MGSPLQPYRQEYAEVMRQEALRDRVRNTRTSRVAAANVAAMRRRYPWLKAGTALALTQAGYGPRDAMVERLAQLDLKGQVRRREADDGGGGGGLLGALDNAWDDAYEGLKNASRWAMAGMASPLEAGVALARNTYGAIDDPSKYSPGDILDIGDQTQIGQMIEGVPAGEGWLPGSRIFEQMGRAARESAPTINGHAWTPGRWVASAITEPGTMEYNILSGITDGAVAYYLDPTSFALKAAGGLRAASAGFKAADVVPLAEQGAWRGLRRFVSAPTVEQYLASPGFVRTGEWLANTSDWAEIWQRTRGQIPVRMVNQLADAKDIDEVRGILKAALGTEIPQQLDIMGDLTYSIKNAIGQGRLWQRLPGRVIDLNDLDSAVVQFDAFQRNANLPLDQILRNNERLARAGSRYEQMKVLQDGADEIFTKLSTTRGVSEARATRLTDLVRGRLKQIEKGATDDIVDDLNDGIGVAIDGATHPSHSAQLYMETLSAGVGMPDPREIRRLTSVFRPILDNATTERMRLPFLAGDWLMTQVWKPFMLVRGAWTVRVIGEEQIRLSAMGIPTAFSHPLSFMAAIVAHKGKVWESLNKEATDILENSLRTSDEAMQALARGTAGFRDTKVRTKFLKMFKPEEEGFARAWADELAVLNHDPVATAVAKSMVEGGELAGPLSVKSAFWDGDLKWVREEFAQAQRRDGFDVRALSDAYIDEVAERIKYATGGDSNLIEAIATGKLKGAAGEVQLRHGVGVHSDFVDELQSLADAQKAPARIKGHTYIEGGKPTDKAVSGWDSAVETMFTYLMSKPTNYLSRSPAFTNFYRAEIERMIPFMDAEGRQAALRNARQWADGTTLRRWESAVADADAKDTIRAASPAFENPGIVVPRRDIEVERAIFQAQHGTDKPTAASYYAREGIIPETADDAAELEKAFKAGTPYTRRQWAERLVDAKAREPQIYMTRAEAEKFRLPRESVQAPPPQINTIEEFQQAMGIPAPQNADELAALEEQWRLYNEPLSPTQFLPKYDYVAPTLEDGSPAWNGEIIDKDALPDELWHGTTSKRKIDEDGFITAGDPNSPRGLGAGRNAKRKVKTVSLTGSEEYANAVAAQGQLPLMEWDGWEVPWLNLGRSFRDPMKQAMLGRLPADFDPADYFERMRRPLKRLSKADGWADDVDETIDHLTDWWRTERQSPTWGIPDDPSAMLSEGWAQIIDKANTYADQFGVEELSWGNQLFSAAEARKMDDLIAAETHVYAITKDQIPDDALITRIGGVEDEYRIYAEIPIRNREAEIKKIERRLARQRDRSPTPFEDWELARITNDGQNANTSALFGWIDDDYIWDDFESAAYALHTQRGVGKVVEVDPHQVITSQSRIDPKQIKHYLGRDKVPTPIGVRVMGPEGHYYDVLVDGHHRMTADWIKTGKGKMRVVEVNDPDLYDRVATMASAGSDSSRYAGIRIIERDIDRIKSMAARGENPARIVREFGIMSDRLDRWGQVADPQGWTRQIEERLDRAQSMWGKVRSGEATVADFHRAVSGYADEVTGVLAGAYTRADAMGISAARADQLAKARALEHTKKTLYDLSERSQFFDTFRLIFPFGEAWKEVLTVWSRIGRENPQTIRRFQQGIQAARGAKIPGTDGQYGFFYKDPTSGEEVFTYPGSAFLTENLLGVPIHLNGRVQGLNIVGNGLPGVGPAVTIPAAYFLPETPDWDFVRQHIFPYGETRQGDVISSIVGAGVPAWLNKFRVGMGDPNQKVLFNNTAMDVARYLANTGEYKIRGPNAEREINRLMADAKQRAKGLWFIRGAVQFFAPSAPQPEMLAKDEEGRLVTAEVLIKDYYKMVDKDPTTAVNKFIDKYGDAAFLYMQPKSRPLVAGAPTTKKGAAWARANGDIVKAYPNVYGLFGPREKEDEFDITTYYRQFDTGERESLTPEQAIQLANHRVASIIYDQAKQKAPGGSAQEREWLRMVREGLSAMYPGFQDFHGLTEKVPTETLVNEVLDAANDKRLRGNSVAEAVNLYRQARDKAMTTALNRGYVGFQDAKNTADIRDWLRQVADAILKRNPDFESVWDQVLRREVQED